MCSAAVIVFYTRLTLINSVLDKTAAQLKSEITCLDIKVNADFKLIVSKLCLNTPWITLEANEVDIEWQQSKSFRFDELISAVTIENLTVQGTRDISSLFTSFKSAKNDESLSSLPQQVNKVIEDIANLEVSISAAIKNYQYFPFIADGHDRPSGSAKGENGLKDKVSSYSGSFYLNKDAIRLTMLTAEKVELLSAKLLFNNPYSSNFNADLSASIAVNLAKAEQLLGVHQIAFRDKYPQLLSLGGTLRSQAVWHDKILTLNNQLNDISISAATMSTSDPSTDAPLNIKGRLQWNNRLSNDVLQFDFNKASQLTLAAEQPSNLMLSISEKFADPISEQWRGLLQGNKLTSIIFKPQGVWQLDFTQAELFVAKIDVIGKNNAASKKAAVDISASAPPVSLTLKDLSLIYDGVSSNNIKAPLAHSTQTANLYVKQLDFILKAQLEVAELNALSTKPLHINAFGTVIQNHTDWHIQLEPNTALTLHGFAFNYSKDGDSKVANNIKQLSATDIVANLNGDIHIAKKNSPHSYMKDSHLFESVSVSLQMNSDVSKLHLTNVFHINQMELSATLDGFLSDITIESAIKADKVILAKINASGDISRPEILLQANNLVLTDLLALKVQLPMNVELIDGMLNYHLHGQVTDFDQLRNNTLHLSVSLEEVTGDIADIWMQNLNYQDQFIFTNGLLTAVPRNQNKVNNLSIASVETLTNFTQFSADTLVYFSKDYSKIGVKLSNVGAETLGGRFDIIETQWPLQPEHSVNVQLTRIDLEKLLELDKKQGIVVTGKISGNLPFSFKDEKILIKEGTLYNTSNGVIQVMNNPAVARLKESSTELKLAFDALQNLHYHQLNSQVSMANDGYMLLDTKIKGRNPDLDNDVNLNLNLSYDLLGLLESLDITNQMEKKLIKHSKKKKSQSTEKH